MLTGYTFVVPLKTKTATEVVQVYVSVSDNGIKQKNQLFSDIATQLGVEHKIYFPPYHPKSSWRIEGFCNLLKASMSKHVSQSLELDQLVPLNYAVYTFLPNKHSKEIPFFLMFGRDPIVPLTLV